MMRERHWPTAVEIAVIITMVVAISVAKGSGSTPALQTSDCSTYRLPEGARLVQAAASRDENAVRISYAMPNGNRGELIVPLSVLAATCVNPRVRATVVSVQETDTEVNAAMCKLVGDVLAGRTQLPPDRERYFDRKFAEEWYQKACLGTK